MEVLEEQHAMLSNYEVLQLIESEKVERKGGSQKDRRTPASLRTVQYEVYPVPPILICLRYGALLSPAEPVLERVAVRQAECQIHRGRAGGVVAVCADQGGKIAAGQPRPAVSHRAVFGTRL